MNNLRVERSTLLVGAALAATVAAFLYFVFLPQKRTISELYAELEAKRASILETSLLPMQMQKLQETMAETVDYIRQHQGQPLDNRHTATLFGQIAQVVAQSGGQSTMFRPGAAIRSETLTQIPVELGCRGNLQQVFQVLEGIERLPQPLWVNELHLERSKKDDDVVECRANLAIFAVDFKISD